MSYGIDTMRMALAMAVHAGQRQEVIAENIAQADTPGYRAQDIAPFAETYVAPELELRQSRIGHLRGEAAAGPRLRDAPGRQSPNGNTVSLEAEMMKAVEVRQQHELALAVYRSSLDIVRLSIGRR